jgi:hypothetical protein
VVSRDDLYWLVWSEPMTKIAERFEVSGSYLARICTLLNAPGPERGYWAKLAHGNAPPQPPLQAPDPGDRTGARRARVWLSRSRKRRRGAGRRRKFGSPATRHMP